MESTDTQSASMKRIRLLLIADQALFRASLGRFLALEPDFEVVGEYAPGADAQEPILASAADVALMEFEPDSSCAGEIISEAASSGFPGRFLVITSVADPCNSARALRLGAAGIFLKSDSAERLIHAIRTVAAGEMWIDARIIREMADRYPLEEQRFDQDGLTEREQKVLLGILGGLSNKKIGEGMKISESSVKAVVQQLFDKTGVRTRSQLVRIAISRSLQAVTPAAAVRSNP